MKEKESIIAEITKLIDDKEHVVQSLYIEMNEKNEKIFALQDEIRKRRHDMNEMSRKIIELDQKLKCCHCKAFLDYEWRPLTRSLSGLSLRSIGTEEKNSNPRWSRISRIKFVAFLIMILFDNYRKLIFAIFFSSKTVKLYVKFWENTVTPMPR